MGYTYTLMAFGILFLTPFRGFIEPIFIVLAILTAATPGYRL